MAEKGSTAGQKDQETRNDWGGGEGRQGSAPSGPAPTYLRFRPRPTLPPYVASRWPRRSALTLLCTGFSARACAVSGKADLSLNERQRVFVSLFKTRMFSSHSLLSFTRGFGGLCGRSRYRPHFPVPSVCSHRRDKV